MVCVMLCGCCVYVVCSTYVGHITEAVGPEIIQERYNSGVKVLHICFACTRNGFLMAKILSRR